jgi:hypothetical protein
MFSSARIKNVFVGAIEEDILASALGSVAAPH